MDRQDKDSIFNELKRLSRHYAPEWSASENGAGTALARLFSELMAENRARLPEMTERHRLMYLNMYGLSRKPAFPARGYITVTPTADNVITLKSGTRAGSAVDAEFVTESDLCAVNTGIKAVFFTKPGVIRRGTQQKLFDNSGENLQEAALYFCSDEILYSGGACRCRVVLLDIASADQHGNAPKAELDPAALHWQYLGASGAENITDVRYEDGVFTLDIPSGVPETTQFGVNGKWIKLLFTDGRMPSAVSKDSIRLSTEIYGAAPKSVYLNENMLPHKGFLPFGEQPSEYDCFYICSTEVFGKKGSRVTISMELVFTENGVNYGGENSVQWKTVIPASKFEQKPPLEKRIEGAVWEYWNGRGWCRIFPDDSHTADFADKTAGSADISFICPQDIQPLFVGADTGLFIRCRVTKITPGYAADMVYCVPHCNALTLGCSYDGQYLRADSVYVSRDMELHDAKNVTVRLPNSESPTDSFACLCLERGLPLGYYNMYIRVKSAAAAQQIRWEALCTVRGERCWQPLYVRDMTAGLSESGMVTLQLEQPMCSASLYGEEGFWLRLCVPSPALSVELEGICFNAVPVIQHSRAVTMDFTAAAENGCYRLSSGGIYSAEAYLCQNGARELIPAEKYTLDGESGILSFNRGFLPQLSGDCTLSVEFTTTLGADGNLPAGAINSFLDPVPFVDMVENPEPAYGGRSVEDPAACAARGADKVRTLERCVSDSDFETAARNADSSVARAKCRSSGGEVRITLLCDSSDIPVFRLARRNVMDAILPSMPFYLQSRLSITRAAYVEIEVTAHVISDGKAFPQTIQSDIRSRLEGFLDPVHGNTAETGFGIGEYPTTESVAAVILSAEHIISADRVQLLCRYRGNVYDYGQISSAVEDGVPVCGNTTIYITEM